PRRRRVGARRGRRGATWTGPPRSADSRRGGWEDHPGRRPPPRRRGPAPRPRRPAPPPVPARRPPGRAAVPPPSGGEASAVPSGSQSRRRARSRRFVRQGGEALAANGRPPGGGVKGGSGWDSPPDNGRTYTAGDLLRAGGGGLQRATGVDAREVLLVLDRALEVGRHRDAVGGLLGRRRDRRR